MIISRLSVSFIALVTLWLGAFVVSASASDKRYGIIIGNADYERGELNVANVKHVENNIKAIEGLFSDVMGIPKANIQVHRNLTTGRMNGLFGNGKGVATGRLRRGITHPDAEVYVYFVGHGSRSQRRSNDEACANLPASVTTSSAGCSEGFLLGIDSDPSDLRNTAYSYDHFIANLAAMKERYFPRGQITVMLESCFSGQYSEGSINTNAQGPLSAPPRGIDALEKTFGILTISAASADEAAYWDDDKEHGIFTHALTRGLHGAADADNDKSITASELQAYLLETVDRGARDIKKTGQTPQLSLSADDAAKTVLVSLSEDEGTYPVPSFDRIPMGDLQSDLELLVEEELTNITAVERRAFIREHRQLLQQCRLLGCEPRFPQLIQQMRSRLQGLDQQFGECQRLGRAIPRGLTTNRSEERILRLVARYRNRCGDHPRLAACLEGKDGRSPACLCIADPSREGCSLSKEELACRTNYETAISSAQARGTVTALDNFIAENQSCVEVKAPNLAKLRTEICGAALADLKQADPEDYDVLAAYLKNQSDCRDEHAEAEGMLQKQFDFVLEVAQDARTGNENERSLADNSLKLFRDTFTTYLTKGQLQRIKSARASLVTTVCEIAYEAARNKNTQQAYTDFIRDNGGNCLNQVRTASAALLKLVCSNEYANVNSQSYDSLKRFVRQNRQCTIQVRAANDALARLGDACVDTVRSRTSWNDNQRLDGYKKCALRFVDVTRVVNEVNGEIRRLERNNFCKAEFTSVNKRSRTSLNNFITSYSSNCVAQTNEARRLLASIPSRVSFDGFYRGTRGYNGFVPRSKAATCRSRYDVQAQISNGRISFFSDGRRWNGTVDQNGNIYIDRSMISPPTRHFTTIQARIDPRTGAARGTLSNGYCGNGYFNIQLTRR